jgi:hypothetical protein
MTNPWASLPTTGPRACPADLPALKAFNVAAAPKHRFDLSLYPEPFFGSQHASVVLLTLNPGWHAEDSQTHSQPMFVDLAVRSLTHALHPYPFLHLQPNAQWPGARWWRQRARELIEATTFDAVAKQIACVQFVPYHSPEFARSSPSLPSQAYSFGLVRAAMARGAEIVVLRSRKLWLDAIPELQTYARLHMARNPRSPYLSRGNLGSAWMPLVQRLQGDAQPSVAPKPQTAPLRSAVCGPVN